MRRSRKRRILRAAKWVLLAVCFLWIQVQVLSVREQFSRQHALALDHYRQEFTLARDELEGSVRKSRQSLLDLRHDLERSTDLLAKQDKDFSAQISQREATIIHSLDSRFSRYQGAIEEILHRSNDTHRRLRSVEEKVEQAEPHDGTWLESSILYPIVQLKGEGTVGSGVVVYSKPQPQGGADGGDHATFVITACHVVMEILGTRFPDGTIENLNVMSPGAPPAMEAYPARVEIYDEERDLAVLRFESTKPVENVAVIYRGSLEALHLFTRVYAVGCPLGNQPMPTAGEISSKSKVVGESVFWMMNAPTFFGNSGGGVFLSQNGHLVGISSMIYTYGKSRPVVVPHMGLFVPIDQVAAWLESRGYRFILSGEPAPIDRVAASAASKPAASPPSGEARASSALAE